MTDATRRALRVAMAAITASIPGVPALAALFDVPAGRVAQIVGVFSFALVVLTAVRNSLEDKTAFPALLKAEPSPGLNPIPDDQPMVEPDPIPSRPVRKPRKRVARDDGQSLVWLLLIVLLLLLILRFV